MLLATNYTVYIFRLEESLPLETHRMILIKTVPFNTKRGSAGPGGKLL